MALRARLTPAQGDPPIGRESIDVHHEDGHVEQLTLHDYARLYALPGVYEQIVQEALGCRSPAVVAQMLGEALDALHRDRGEARVIDVAAGNGVSGEALRAEGMTPVLGTDIVPEARAAALRDRPDVYGEYLTLDLLALDDARRGHLRGLEADALTCVAPVGAAPGMVPPRALVAVAALLAPDALVVALYDPRHGDPDALTERFWVDALDDDDGGGTRAVRLAHRRYLHRFTVAGGPFELEASVWRISRGRAAASPPGAADPGTG